MQLKILSPVPRAISPCLNKASSWASLQFPTALPLLGQEPYSAGPTCQPISLTNFSQHLSPGGACPVPWGHGCPSGWGMEWDGMGWDGLSGPALTDAGGASSSHSLVHGETLGPLQKGVSQALEIKLHMYSLKLHK